MDCVTDAAATRSLHTQTCNFLCYISLSCYIHPPRDGCYRLPDERVVWTAWRLRDWWCCLTRAIWFCTAWLMLLPHQACTLSPENGFCLIRCWCMNCVTTAWLMLLCLLPVLHSDCVTDAAVTCTEAHEWGEWTCKCGYRTAWLLMMSHWVCCSRLPDCLELYGLRYWWCCYTNWGYLSRVRDNCVTDAAATPGLHIQSYIMCQAFVAKADVTTALMLLQAGWLCIVNCHCVTTAWLILLPHRGCQAVSCCPECVTDAGME